MTKLSTRQEALLGRIIQAYIGAAKPVSSGQLVDQRDLSVSPATIRNDMAALTEAGYLQQPHTSAGRIPTETAWRWYLDQQAPDHVLSKSEQHALQEVIRQHKADQDELLRFVAKTLAELADDSVLVAFDRHDTFYTGISNLFRHPEFEHVDLIQSLSDVVDHLDEVVSRVYSQIGNDMTVWIGKDNPFSHVCGTVITRYQLGKNHHGLLGILGPMRQDYSANLARMRYTQSLLAAL